MLTPPPEDQKNNDSPELSSVREEVDRPHIELSIDDLTLNEWIDIPHEEITYQDKELGRGYSSIIKLGLWKHQGREQAVALKVFNEDHNDVYVKELGVMVKLKTAGPHPHVVKIIGEIESLEPPVLVLEVLSGLVLTDWLKNHPRTDVATSVIAYRHALEILSGLKYLRANSIIHGDLKPDNIKLNAQGQAVILDFGFSRIMPAGSSSMRVRISHGTPQYAAYEKFEMVGDSHIVISFETDIYSYALLLLLCASKHGHEVNPELNTLAKIRQSRSTGALPPIPPEVPPNTRHLIVRCLSFSQFDRPTADEAYKVLEGEVKAGRFSV